MGEVGQRAGNVPREAVVALPARGLTVYRLTAGGTPTLADFSPMSPARAAARGVPELLRVGLSVFLERQQAEAVRLRPSSCVVEVRLREGRRIHIARTGNRPGHLTVWAPIEELLECVEAD